MTSRLHEVTLIHEDNRHVRLILAENSIQALRTAISKLPGDVTGPCAMICKPLCGLPNEQSNNFYKEALPCC
jgi:hypothetical protein